MKPTTPTLNLSLIRNKYEKTAVQITTIKSIGMGRGNLWLSFGAISSLKPPKNETNVNDSKNVNMFVFPMCLQKSNQICNRMKKEMSVITLF